MKACVYLSNGALLGSWPYAKLVEMKVSDVVVINNRAYTIYGYHLNTNTQSWNIYVQ